MSEQVIIVLSDLHFVCNGRSNRLDIMQEQQLLKAQILKVCKKYDNPIIVLLGDVFDRGFRIPHRLGEEMSFFVSLREQVKDIYSVVGNHEITYYTNNPFWNLVTEVDSIYLNSLSKNTAPRGAAGVIKVQDTLDIGGLLLRFNHYNQPLDYAKDGELEILFSHNPLYDDYLRKSSSGFVPEYVDKSKSIAPVFSYKLSFLGHMHWLYGVWDTDNNGSVYGLAALGRPNITEIRDDFLERNIPAIKWDLDKKLLSVEDNLFRLPSRAKCVNEDILQEENKSGDLVIELTEIVTSTEFKSPLEKLQSRVSNDARLHILLNNLLEYKDVSKEFLMESIDLVKRRGY